MWAHLTPELFKPVVSYLSRDDIAACALVCSQWKRCVDGCISELKVGADTLVRARYKYTLRLDAGALLVCQLTLMLTSCHTIVLSWTPLQGLLSWQRNNPLQRSNSVQGWRCCP